MATICAMVLILPSQWTATLRLAPSCAIHSRSADMAISRPTMTRAISALIRVEPITPSVGSCRRIISAAVTISLSATGSRNAPKLDVWFQRRASQPSSQSVTAATTKMIVAVAFLAGPPSHASGRKNTPTTSGIRTMRSQVRRIGRLRGMAVGSDDEVRRGIGRL